MSCHQYANFISLFKPSSTLQCCPTLSAEYVIAENENDIHPHLCLSPGFSLVSSSISSLLLFDTNKPGASVVKVAGVIHPHTCPLTLTLSHTQVECMHRTVNRCRDRWSISAAKVYLLVQWLLLYHSQQWCAVPCSVVAQQTTYM